MLYNNYKTNSPLDRLIYSQVLTLFFAVFLSGKNTANYGDKYGRCTNTN